MNRVDVRLAKITGQAQREFEIVVVEDEEELGFFGRIGSRVLRSLGVDLSAERPRRRWFRSGS